MSRGMCGTYRVPPIRAEAIGRREPSPFVHAYWTDPALPRRLGENTDTFAEFVERVRRFQERMGTLADGTVIFGHGIWLAMLQWHFEGQGVTNAAGMRAFREF